VSTTVDLELPDLARLSVDELLELLGGLLTEQSRGGLEGRGLRRARIDIVKAHLFGRTAAPAPR
jgi:hypothetical protein